MTTLQQYKTLYKEINQKDWGNPELEKIKRNYINGDISREKAINEMQQLHERLINNQR